MEDLSIHRSCVLHQEDNKYWSDDQNNHLILKFTGKHADDDAANFAQFYNLINFTNIKTFFIKQTGYCEYLLQSVEYFPVIVKISSIVNNEIAQLYGLKYGSRLNQSITEWKFKSKNLSNPKITTSHIHAFKLISGSDISMLESKSYTVFNFLSGVFASKGFILGSIELQFGKNDYGEMILATDLTVANIELWKMPDFQWIDISSTKLREILSIIV